MVTYPSAPILLVDDEPANLLALEAVLENLGEPLVRAGSGEAALRQLRDQDFAAVLLDVRMPGMDGFETARLIRAQRRSRATPILFITADSSDLSAEEAYAMGAVDFLTKPLKPAILKAKLAFFVELHRSKQELEAAERQAVQGRAFLSAVLEAVEDGIVACDAGGNLTLFNRATLEFHGLSADSVEAQRSAEVQALFEKDGKSALAQGRLPLMRALHGEQIHDHELVIAPPGGKARSVLVSGQPLFDEAGARLGAVVSMHDMTAQQEAQAARETAASEQIRREEAEAAAALVRDGQERVRLATDAARLGIWAWHEEGDRLCWDNDRLYALFGVEDGQAPAQARQFIEEFVHADDRESFEQAMAFTACIGTRLHFEGRFTRRSDGRQRWMELTGVLHSDDRGAPRRILGTAADITERKHAEQDLKRLATELAETDRRKTEFLATLAHELRNPLAPISNGLQMLRMAGDNPEAQQKARAMMERQLRHMVHLVDDLLDIARISSNKVELRLERLQLQSVLASAVETSTPLMVAAGHTLEVSVPDEPMEVTGDATRLAQVVSNLLNNAAKYTPHGGTIVLQARREGGQAVVSVADTGVGIAQEALGNVFEMFTQVGRNRDRSQGGLGIGLALVTRLVELHGGTVTAASGGVGAGSTFTVRLPLSAAVIEPLAAKPVAEPAQAAAGALRVLVVDDNVDAADSLASLLELEGHDTRVAHDGDNALSSAHEFRPDIVFLDIGMPGKDGYQVARELRSQPDTRNAVIVALTGWGAEEDRKRTRNAGFDHHLTKPAGLSSVEALLGEIVKARSADRDLSLRA